MSLEHDDGSFCACDFIAPGSWNTLQKEGLTGAHAVLILSDTLNEENKTGEKVFLYQLGPDAEITSVVTHDSWEQVVIVEGQLAWLNQDEDQSVQCVIEKGGYVNRPPHVNHGPFRAGAKGCLMVVRYYF